MSEEQTKFNDDVLIEYHFYYFLFCIAEFCIYIFACLVVICRIKGILKCRNYLQMLVFLTIFTCQIVEDHILRSSDKHLVHVSSGMSDEDVLRAVKIFTVPTIITNVSQILYLTCFYIIVFKFDLMWNKIFLAKFQKLKDSRLIVEDDQKQELEYSINKCEKEMKIDSSERFGLFVTFFTV